MLATIPYETFPKITLGPLELRTFGVMVGLGVLIGAWVAARYIEQHTGIVRDETYRLATLMVVFGVIGARCGPFDLVMIPIGARLPVITGALNAGIVIDSPRNVAN